MPDPFHLLLLTAVLSCALVAGLVFGFAVVVMPGIASLEDRGFLRAFKYMDRLIQDSEPAFMLVWVGSVVAVLATAAAAPLQLSGRPLYLLWFAAGLYMLTVQLPTARFNIPLNNELQALELDSLSEAELAAARLRFEEPWNRWNRFRTVGSIASVSIMLVVLLAL